MVSSSFVLSDCKIHLHIRGTVYSTNRHNCMRTVVVYYSLDARVYLSVVVLWSNLSSGAAGAV